MGAVILDELNEQELKAKKKLTKRQKEVLKAADTAGGIIYRYKLRKQKHPTLRCGTGKISFPPPNKPSAKTYETYNKVVESLVEKGLMGAKKNVYLLSWSGWRIAKVLNQEDE